MTEDTQEFQFRNPVRELGTIKVPHEIILDNRLSDGAYCTLLFYLYYKQHNLEPPKIAAVAKTRRRSIKTINRHRQELAVLGYITIPPQEGWIYVVQCSNFYKIGKTNDVAHRFAQLQSSMPFPLRLEHQSQHDDVVQTERELHTMFSDKRIRGEWFELSDEDLKWFECMEGSAT